MAQLDQIIISVKIILPILVIFPEGTHEKGSQADPENVEAWS